MGVTDWGEINQPLGGPALGGAGGWADSVAQALNNSDETVDDRIADSGITRITRPNVDDRLVEQWNGSAWSVVDYVSGWRDVEALCTPNVTANYGAVRLRRDNNRVTLLLRISNTVTATAHELFAADVIPPGWRYNYFYVTGIMSRGGTSLAEGGYSSIGGATLASHYYTDTASWTYCELSYITNDSVPTSLPGTLITAAPQ